MRDDMPKDDLQKTTVEQFVSTEEGKLLFEQERTILDVTELICRLMKENGVSKADLARRLGKSKAYITTLLDGGTNMTLRTISDVMCVLGSSLYVSDRPVEHSFKLEVPSCLAATTLRLKDHLQVFGDYTFDFAVGVPIASNSDGHTPPGPRMVG